MLLEEDTGDGFFQSGPGFGGAPPVSNSARPPAQTARTNTEYADIAERFGVVQHVEPGLVSQSSYRRTETSNHDQSYGLAARQPVATRTVERALAPRLVIPKDPMKLLASFIKSNGGVHYEALPEEDKKIVNFSKDVYKVVTTKPGDVFVRLVDRNIDISELVYTGKALRDPIEDDVSYMMDEIGVPRGRRLVKPIVFVPPRGFLILIPEEPISIDMETKIEMMETYLKRHVDTNCPRLKEENIRPGMMAVLVYIDGTEVRYYRVLILGRAHREGDFMVLLVDNDKQYFVDVTLDELVMLPEECGLKVHTPNILFSTLCGVEGLSQSEQKVLWKNVDAIDGRRMVYSLLGVDGEGVPTIDMIWRDEMGRIEWLSQIVKRRGASMFPNMRFPHLQKSAHSYLPANDIEDEYVIDFIDYAGLYEGDFQRDSDRGEMDQLSQRVEEVLAIEPILSSHCPPSPVLPNSPNPFSINSIDLMTVFKKLVDDKNHAAVFGMSQFVRSVLQNVVSPEESERLIEFMKHLADRSLNLKL